jgi:hypothetical protein
MNNGDPLSKKMNIEDGILNNATELFLAKAIVVAAKNPRNSAITAK